MTPITRRDTATDTSPRSTPALLAPTSPARSLPAWFWNLSPLFGDGAGHLAPRDRASLRGGLAAHVDGDALARLAGVHVARMY